MPTALRCWGSIPSASLAVGQPHRWRTRRLSRGALLLDIVRPEYPVAKERGVGLADRELGHRSKQQNDQKLSMQMRNRGRGGRGGCAP